MRMDAPSNVSVKTGIRYCHITWDPPAGALHYNISKGEDPGSLAFYKKINIPDTGYNDTDVTPWTTYYYSIIAVDNTGVESSPVDISAMPGDKPPIPKNLTLESGNGFILLDWEPANEATTLTVTGYSIYRGPASNSLELLSTVDASVVSLNDTDVENGNRYYYAIASINDFSESARTTARQTTPVGPPSEPLNLTTTAGDGFVYLEWDTPQSDGGSSIISFNLHRGESAGAMTLFKELNPSRNNYNDTEVDNGLVYHYKMFTVTDEGMSGPSNTVSGSPLGPPGTPLNVTVTSGDGFVAIRWEIPSDDGGSDLTSIELLRAVGSGEMESYQSLPPSTTEFNDTDLTNGEEYSYQLTSVSNVGSSPTSPKVSVVPYGIPTPPGTLEVETGSGWAILTWTASTDDGGSPITSYVIYRKEGNNDFQEINRVNGNLLTFNDTTARIGYDYVYRVSARTAVAEGEPSNEEKAEIRGLPDPPTSFRVIAVDGGLQLQWKNPTNTGGSDLSGINIYRTADGGSEELLTSVEGSATSFTDTDVEEGIQYTYRISALTEVGESHASSSVDKSYQPVSGDDDDDDTDDDDTGDDDDDDGGSLGLLIGGFGAIAAVVVVLILLFMFKKKKDEEMDESTPKTHKELAMPQHFKHQVEGPKVQPKSFFDDMDDDEFTRPPTHAAGKGMPTAGAARPGTARVPASNAPQASVATDEQLSNDLMSQLED